ncbi:MAG: hypothetical protein RSA79_02480 [Oscillospiraceae bacterium]
MQVLFLVLNKVDCLENLLINLAQAGVKGGTIIDSTGMARALGDSEDNNIWGSLRMLLDPQREESKTLFFILENEQVATVRKIINEVTGGLDKPDSGIMFGFDLLFVEGLKK